jgi:mannose-6-phosphate isomerase
VHPGDELAARRHNCSGKTEMWYVIRAEKGAKLLSGFSRQIGPEQYGELVRRDEIVSVLASHDVSEGDVFFLPAGRVHAIGAG